MAAVFRFKPSGGGGKHKVVFKDNLAEIHRFDKHEPPLVHLSDKTKPPALLRQITGKDGHRRIAAAIGHQNERELIFQLLEQVTERFRRGTILKEQKVILKNLIIARELEKVKLVLEIFS